MTIPSYNYANTFKEILWSALYKKWLFLAIIMLTNDYPNDNYGIKWLFLVIIIV